MSLPILSRRPLAALGLTGLAAAAFTRSAAAQSVDDVLSKKKVQVGILVGFATVRCGQRQERVRRL